MNSENTSREDANSMDAVRDLLFGKRNQEIDDRFESLESGLFDSMKRVEERMNARMDSIHQFVKAEIGALSAPMLSLDDRLRSEVENRKFDLNSMNDVVGALDSKCEEKAVELQSSIEHLAGKSREELKEQLDCLRSEIDSIRDELNKRVNAEIEKLSASAAHRSDLSGFLIDLGMKYQMREMDPPHESPPQDGSVELHG
ncbi:hypothetical protein VSU19_19075 [Verrucomicrobiales bacterium BCK34]|nr:hypothetical protein [Verrucomicrobiales bacterium BCK34]